MVQLGRQGGILKSCLRVLKLLNEMFEGDFTDMSTHKISLVLMRGPAKCAQTGCEDQDPHRLVIWLMFGCILKMSFLNCLEVL